MDKAWINRFKEEREWPCRWEKTGIEEKVEIISEVLAEMLEEYEPDTTSEIQGTPTSVPSNNVVTPSVWENGTWRHEPDLVWNWILSHAKEIGGLVNGNN